MTEWFKITERALAEGHYYVKAENADAALERARRASRDGLEGNETDILWDSAEVISGTYKVIGKANRVDSPPEWLVDS